VCVCVCVCVAGRVWAGCVGGAEMGGLRSERDCVVVRFHARSACEGCERPGDGEVGVGVAFSFTKCCVSGEMSAFGMFMNILMGCWNQSLHSKKTPPSTSSYALVGLRAYDVARYEPNRTTHVRLAYHLWTGGRTGSN
jgi:hypothetical protein